MSQSGLYATYIDYTSNTSSALGQIPMGAVHTSLSGVAAQHRVTDRNTPGDLKNLYVNVLTNANANNITVAVRKNGSVGSLSITVPASTTGVLTDLSGTDSVADGDTFNHTVTTGASATAFVAICGVQFETAGQFAFQPAAGAAAGNIISSASTTSYSPSYGPLTGNTNETLVRYAAIGNITISKLQTYISANGRSTDTVVVSRNNGADGTQTVTIAASATGLFEDTTNTDSVADGNYFDVSFTTGTGTGNLSRRFFSYKIETASDSWCPLYGLTGFAVAASASTQRAFVDSARTGGTPIPYASHASQLYVSISANTVSAASTLTLRVNGTPTALSATIPANTTGKFIDTSNAVALAPGDLVDVEVVAGAGGTSLTVREYGVLICADKSLDAADTVLPMIADTVALSALVDLAETLLPRITDVATLRVLAALADTLLPMLDDVAAPLVAVSVADALLPRIDDLATLLVALTGTDAVTIRIDDMAAVLAMLSAADTLLPRITDAAAIMASLQVDDGVALALAEAASIAVLVGLADQLDPVLVDAVANTVYIDAADGLSVTLAEAAAITIPISVSDTLLARLSPETIDVLLPVLRIFRATPRIRPAIDAAPSVGASLGGGASVRPAIGGKPEVGE